MMTKDEAIQRFEKQLTDARVVLDSGFGTHEGECDIVYRHRKEMAEIALAALRRTAEDDKAPPCKVGDTLYEIDLPEYGVITCKVLWIDYYNGPEFHRPGNGIVSVWSAHVEVIDGHGKGSTYDFEHRHFGACVFLTPEAARAALGGGEGG